MINSISKIDLVKASLINSTYKDKKKYIINKLKELSEHQSGWFLRKFSSEIPHSLQIVICDLTDAQNLEKGLNKQKTYNDTLIEVCSEYLAQNKNDKTIQNILNKAKNNKLINKNNGITSSAYTKYDRIKRFGGYGFCEGSKEITSLNMDKKKCTITYPNGDIYKGEFIKKANGYIVPNGNGELTFKEGVNIYKGKFKDGWADDKNGVLECRSQLLLDNGFTKTNRTVIEGEFIMGCFNEKSNYTIRYPYGDTYKCEWYLYDEVNKRCIKSMSNSNGIYEGDFIVIDIFYCKLLAYGNGKLTYRNGAIFEGKFKDGKQYEGKLTYNNGDIYQGKFKDGERYKGKLTHKNGIIFEGYFKEGGLYKGKYTKMGEAGSALKTKKVSDGYIWV